MRVAAAALGICALLAVGVGVARATAGGETIALAPVVTAGVQQGGNTSTATDSCQTQDGYEFWNLQLTQGDLVKITWSTPPAVDTLALFAAGTTDADHTGCLYGADWNGWTQSPILSDTNTAAGAINLSQTVATADGSYPLLFLDTTGTGNAGTYAFTVDVLHAASVLIPPLGTVPNAGKLTVSVLAPDSNPITDSTLKLTLNGYWGRQTHKLGTATPSGGLAAFDYTLPARLLGKKIQLGITGAGPTYQPVTTQEQTVKVLMPAGSGPVLLTPSQLKLESKLLHESIYWAGPTKGYNYEFTITAAGYAYVRYLPRGTKVGTKNGKFLIVATYPLSGAYAALEKYAHGKVSHGPHGSIYVVRAGNPTSVLVAFRGVDYEIEVYDPHPAVAKAVAASGAVARVR